MIKCGTDTPLKCIPLRGQEKESMKLYSERRKLKLVMMLEANMLKRMPLSSTNRLHFVL